jgi:hypothetical protein
LGYKINVLKNTALVPVAMTVISFANSLQNFSASPEEKFGR